MGVEKRLLLGPASSVLFVMITTCVQHVKLLPNIHTLWLKFIIQTKFLLELWWLWMIVAARNTEIPLEVPRVHRYATVALSVTAAKYVTFMVLASSVRFAQISTCAKLAKSKIVTIMLW
jgi:hypothetical protein